MKRGATKTMKVVGILLVLSFLFLIAVPIGNALLKPTVTLPANWYLKSETAYPSLKGIHDPQGAGQMAFESNDSADFVVVNYENLMGQSYSIASLTEDATSILAEYQNETVAGNISSGNISISGIISGYCQHTQSGESYWEFVWVRGNYYFDVYFGENGNSAEGESGWQLIESLGEKPVQALTVTETITGFSLPEGLAVTPNGKYVYVANRGSGSVSVISTASNTVKATVTALSSSYDVAVTPNGEYAYVTNGGWVSVISTDSNTVKATVSVGYRPTVGDAQFLAVSPNGEYVYVANDFGTDGGTVSVISTASNTVKATVTVGNGPNDVAVCPNGEYAYVTNYGGTVSVISTASNIVKVNVTVGGDPIGVAVTPNGEYAYVANADGTVSVISTASNTVNATATLGGNPQWVAITPDGKYAYVTNADGSVLVISTTLNTVTTVSPSPSVPEFLAQLSGITLVVFMIIIIISVIIIAKKKIAWKI